jgi:hypothetical protein
MRELVGKGCRARLINAKRTSAKDLGMYVLKLTNRLFLTVFTAASITGMQSPLDPAEVIAPACSSRAV